jgi:hypothetical protein
MQLLHTYDEWKLNYFTACKYSGIWHNKYVSVCDPEVPRNTKLNMDREEFWAQGDHIISTEDASRFALTLSQKSVTFYYDYRDDDC